MSVLRVTGSLWAVLRPISSDPVKHYGRLAGEALYVARTDNMWGRA